MTDRITEIEQHYRGWPTYAGENIAWLVANTRAALAIIRRVRDEAGSSPVLDEIEAALNGERSE